MCATPRLISLLLLLLLLLSAFAACAAGKSEGGKRWWDPTSNPAPVFRGEQFFNITERVGFGAFPGHVAAFGDFNNDRYTDFFVLDPARRVLSVVLWDPSEWALAHAVTATVASTTPIVNVAVNDVNYDGALDAVVTSLGPAASNGSQTYDVDVLLNSQFAEFYAVTDTITGLADQPVLLDWNGDMRTDIVASLEGRTVVFLNDGNGTFGAVPLDTGLPRLTVPHTVAFLDIDGDCHADIFLAERDSGKYSVWLWNGTNYTRSSREYPVPDGAGQVSFADFNRDGSVDMAFPVCWPPETCTEVNAIVLSANVQKLVCGSKALASKKESCRSMTALCTADPDFRFATDAAGGFSAMAEGVTVVPKALFDKHGWRFAGDPTGQPLVLHVGDYNLDGFPDLLVPVVEVKTGLRTVQLFESLACNSTLCPEINTSSTLQWQRTFRPVLGSGTAELTGISGAYAAAFVDIGESGYLGAVVLYDPDLDINASVGAQRQTVALFNNFKPDALFIKVTGLNGVCAEWCPAGPRFPDPKPYGVSYPGGAFKFALTDTDSSTLSAGGTATYSTAYLSLQTPYVMFGLGRVSNYIETIFYGVASAEAQFSNMWQGVIPNSQLVVIPYRPAKPSGWSMELFLSPPSGIFFWVGLSAFVLLCILGAVVVFFRVREHREDVRSREERRHLFDFNSL